MAGFTIATTNKLIVYIICATSLLIGAYLVFRLVARRDYARIGRLTPLSSFLELFICIAYATLPYLYNPPCWPYVWDCKPHSPPLVAVLGYLLIVMGVILGFGSMFYLGIQRSFGLQVTSIYRTGAYRYSRNPQVLGGFLMVLGIALLWPSWYALGWVALWVLMFHPMILTEEEHLRKVHSQEYESYCRETPRYVGFRKRI